MKTQSSTPTIGLDLGDRRHAVCVLGGDGKILRERTIANSRKMLDRLSESYPGAVMVMEVGMHSPWTSRFLEARGHRVIVANPRKTRAICKRPTEHLWHFSQRPSISGIYAMRSAEISTAACLASTHAAGSRARGFSGSGSRMSLSNTHSR